MTMMVAVMMKVMAMKSPKKTSRHYSIHLLSEVADDRCIKVHRAKKWNCTNVCLLHGVIAVIITAFTTKHPTSNSTMNVNVCVSMQGKVNVDFCSTSS